MYVCGVGANCDTLPEQFLDERAPRYAGREVRPAPAAVCTDFRCVLGDPAYPNGGNVPGEDLTGRTVSGTLDVTYNVLLDNTYSVVSRDGGELDARGNYHDGSGVFGYVDIDHWYADRRLENAASFGDASGIPGYLGERPVGSPRDRAEPPVLNVPPGILDGLEVVVPFNGSASHYIEALDPDGGALSYFLDDPDRLRGGARGASLSEDGVFTWTAPAGREHLPDDPTRLAGTVYEHVCQPDLRVKFVFGQMLRFTHVPDLKESVGIGADSGVGDTDWLGATGAAIQQGAEGLFTNLFLALMKALVGIQIFLMSLIVGIMADMLTSMVIAAMPVFLVLTLIPKGEEIANKFIDAIPALLLLPLMSAIILVVGSATIVEIPQSTGPFDHIYTWIISIGVVFFAISLPVMMVPLLKSATQMATQIVSSAVSSGAMVTGTTAAGGMRGMQQGMGAMRADALSPATHGGVQPWGMKQKLMGLVSPGTVAAAARGGLHGIQQGAGGVNASPVGGMPRADISGAARSAAGEYRTAPSFMPGGGTGLEKVEAAEAAQAAALAGQNQGNAAKLYKSGATTVQWDPKNKTPEENREAINDDLEKNGDRGNPSKEKREARGAWNGPTHEAVHGDAPSGADMRTAIAAMREKAAEEHREPPSTDVALRALMTMRYAAAHGGADPPKAELDAMYADAQKVMDDPNLRMGGGTAGGASSGGGGGGGSSGSGGGGESGGGGGSSGGGGKSGGDGGGGGGASAKSQPGGPSYMGAEAPRDRGGADGAPFGGGPRGAGEAREGTYEQQKAASAAHVRETGSASAGAVHRDFFNEDPYTEKPVEGAPQDRHARAEENEPPPQQDSGQEDAESRAEASMAQNEERLEAKTQEEIRKVEEAGNRARNRKGG